MRKIFWVSIVVFLICGCGGGGGGSKNSPGNSPNSNYTITINVFDKEKNNEELTEASLWVAETNQTAVIQGSSYQITLAQGSYSIYLSKQGYITQGYTLNLNKNLTANVYLRKETSRLETKGEIQGELNENGGRYYSGQFSIFAGNKETYERYDSDKIGNPFEVQSPTGDIVVSAFTKINGAIDKIAYLKTTCPGTLSETLELPLTGVRYSGNKPESDELTVKLSDGYYLAEQKTDSSTFSFIVNLQNDDAITLESLTRENDVVNKFARVEAGGIGSTNINIQYQSETPGFTVDDNGDYYTVTFNTVSFASYYEVYAIVQIGEGENDFKLPFCTACLNGASVKVPKFDLGLGSVLFVRAVKLDGFDVNLMLNGNQNYNNYSYTEIGQGLNVDGLSIKALSITKFNLSRARQIIQNKYNLKYLCLE